MNSSQSHVGPAARAQEAEAMRRQGIFSGAIEGFTDVLRDDPNNAWAHAHRGASRAAIFDLSGAVRDLDAAIELRARDGRRYPWAHAHKGEAYRLYARFYMWSPDGPSGVDLEDLLARSDECFDAALEGQPDYPWASAHHAATCTYQYSIARHVSRMEERDCAPYADKALMRFEQALQPGAAEYAWAHAFKEFLLMVRDRAGEARIGMSDGELIDMDRRLLVLEPLSALRNFERRYHEAARCGWLRLQEDPHAIIASYFTASSVAALHKEGSGPDAPTTAAVIRQAQAILRHREILSRTLRASLEYQRDRSNIKPIQEALERLRAEPDLETYFLINLDSSLAELRAEHPDWFMPPPAQGAAPKHKVTH